MRFLLCATVCLCLLAGPALVRAQAPAVPKLDTDLGLTVTTIHYFQSERAESSDTRYSGAIHLILDGDRTIPVDSQDLSAIVQLIKNNLPDGWDAVLGTDKKQFTITPKGVLQHSFALLVDASLYADAPLYDEKTRTPFMLSSKYYGSAFAQTPQFVQIRTSIDGPPIELHNQSWIFRSIPGYKPVITLTKQEPDCTAIDGALNSFSTSCKKQLLLARNDRQERIDVVMWVADSGLRINPAAIGASLGFSVNGSLPIDPQNGPFLISIDYPDLWHIDWWLPPKGCRLYNYNSEEHDKLELYEPNPSIPSPRNNYIIVSNAKVFDTGLLQQMLNSTASQLAAISGFNSASITGAFGNFQGVARDTSYLSAQVTTTPLPTIATSNASGLTGTLQTVNGSANPSQTSTTVTLQCPNGSLPTLGSGSTEGCAVPTPPSGVTITVPPTSTGTITTNGTTTPGNTTQQTTGSQTTQQNSITSTTNGVAGTVPTAPTATPFSPPTNVGVSSADILTEQVELNAQITNLRLLLQGALSDQYVIRHSRPVATRKQSTLGFTITLDPPRQFRHAVAEVRVLIVPEPGPDGVSIVNLLPAEKTYNVAKITSHQDAFGAGVAVAPISVGAAAGRSKDRLYLVKDTDTLALQYPPPIPTLQPMKRPLPQYAHDKYKGSVDLIGWGELGDCNIGGRIGTNATLFGWQFRPVLGEEYVRGGQRQVFAQLAMPPNLTTQSTPFNMFIQTRWRAYDPKRQVVGATYTSSCNLIQDLSGVADIPTISVKDVDMVDLGGGILKLTNHGQFTTPSLSVLAGSTNIVPLASDGETLQLFGKASDLLAADKLEILGPSGTMTAFGKRSKKEGCGFDAAALSAVPYPDGNSRMTLTLTIGKEYLPEIEDGERKIAADGLPMPLVLIGSQVYGLRETPFQECVGESCRCKPDSAEEDSDKNGDKKKTDGAKKGSLVCTYKFVAPTTDVRNAQSFLVKDLRWEDMSRKGTTDFFPLFSALTATSSPADTTCPDKNSTPPAKPCPDPAPAKSATLMVSGFDFDKLKDRPVKDKGKSVPATDTDCIASPNDPCLKVIVGDDDKNVPKFTPVTRNLATLVLPQGVPKGAKTARFLLTGEPLSNLGEYNVEWDLALPKPDKTVDVTATPATLRVSDSRAVVFEGDQIANVDKTTVRFYGDTLQTLVADFLDPNDKKKLTVYVTTAVTKTPGHKELSVDIPPAKPGGTKKTIQLPIDVYK
jgi:hypothetical protein